MINELDRKALENFVMDLDLLEGIESRFDEFNAFDVLKIANNEIRHSNVLAWLMNPNENHGLGDAFLKKFVQSIFLRNSQNLEFVKHSLIDISLFDYDDFIIRREWHNIDILTVSEENRFVVVIEHKIGSKESEHQLNKYKKIVDDEFSDYDKIFLFLAATGDQPSDYKNWVIVDYSFILDIIGNIIYRKGEFISESIRLFITQYMQILRRDIVGDAELERVCREIYNKHQKALDLIFEYKPDIYLDVSKTMEHIIDDYPNLIKETANKIYIRFTTKKLDAVLEKRGSKDWVPSQRVLMFEIQNKYEKVVLKMLIGPGENWYRQKLYNVALEIKDVLKGVPNTLGTKWTQIYARDLLSKGFIEKNAENYENIQKELESRLKKFMNEELCFIEDAIVDALKTSDCLTGSLQ